MKQELMKTKLKILVLAFTLALMPLTRMVVQARPQADDAQRTAKVKAEVAKRISNKKTKVKVKLQTGEKLKGRIDGADDNGFTVTEDKTNKQIQMSYAEVQEVKGRGGLSTPVKIAIVAGIAIGVLAIIAVVAVKTFDPFSGGITAR